MMDKTLKSAAGGAIHGLIAWLAYGTVEFFVACLIPLVLSAEKTFSPWTWRMTWILLAAYPAVGLLLGAGAAVLAGVARRGMAEEFHYRLAAALTLVLAFIANLLTTRLTAVEVIALSVALSVAAAMMAALVSESWRLRAGFLSNPWTVSLLLLAAPWISGKLQQSTIRIRVVVVVLGITAIAVTGALCYRLWPPARGWSRSLAGVIAVLLLCLGTARLLDSRQPSIASNPVRAPQGKPNVLLITMDTVRADHLSLYGYSRDTTPNLKNLAREATVYTHAIAAGDMTLASHASLFTGLYPGWHHAVYAPPEWPLGRPLDDKYTTLAEMLQSKGYFTVAVVGNSAYLVPSFNLNQGFSVYCSRTPVVTSWWALDFYLRNSIQRLLISKLRITEFEGSVQRAEEINREALASLPAASGRPFFQFINYMDAHDPYMPPAPFDMRFPGKKASFTVPYQRQVEVELMKGKRAMSAADQGHLVSQYDGGIAYIDSEIGRLMAELKRRDLYENTLIIVTSDHGEAIGESGLLGHGVTSLYQNLIHVPLLIRYPGQHQARSVDIPVSHVDFLPTVLDVLGYTKPAWLQGRSLTEDPDPDRAIFSESYAQPRVTKFDPGRFIGIKRAMFSRQAKLITWTNGPTEMYDLSADPNELRNLFKRGEETWGALTLRLAGWTKSIPAPVVSTQKAKVVMDLDNLRSLGYVQ